MDTLEIYVRTSNCNMNECPYGEDTLCVTCMRRMVAEHDEKVRADAIKEFVTLIENEMPYDICDGNEAIEEIKKIAEQMKERKKMRVTVELPCAVGDTAYYVHRKGVQEVTVDSFIFNTNLFANVSYYVGCERFGKTLTP